MKTDTATLERINELFSYDKKTGKLYRKINISSRARIGDEAGYDAIGGYRRIGIDKTQHYIHRIVWLLFNNEWPDGEIDHINGITNDNRIENLRVTSHAENCKNQKRRITNNSGVMGVSFVKASRKWQIEIQKNGRKLYLGISKCVGEAACIRAIAEKDCEYHHNHGRTA